MHRVVGKDAPGLRQGVLKMMANRFIYYRTKVPGMLLGLGFRK